MRKPQRSPPTVGEAISCVGFWGPDQHDLQKPTSAARRGPRCGCVAQLGHCQQSLAAKPWLPSPGLRAAKPSSSGHKPRILGMDLGVFPWLGTLHNPKWLDLVGKPADFWGTTIGNTHFTVFWGDQMDQPTDMAPPPSCLNIQVVQVIQVQYFKSPWDTAVVCYVVFSPCPHHMSLG